MSDKSENYEKVKKHYDDKYWSITKVKNVVSAPIPWITEEEYKEITGFEYPNIK